MTRNYKLKEQHLNKNKPKKLKIVLGAFGKNMFSYVRDKKGNICFWVDEKGKKRPSVKYRKMKTSVLDKNSKWYKKYGDKK